MKRVAIAQSNYIPWKGYFDLINFADELILYDDVQYTKNDWRNRNKIKTKDGLMWITIPIRYKYPQKIKDTVISYNGWNRKHWKSIITNYAKARHFSIYKEVFEELYLKSNERFLSQINRRFLDAICNILGIRTKISWSMDYELIEGKTERLVDLCKKVGAAEYFSGPSAKGYLDKRMFEEEGIKVTYMDYASYLEYNQLFPPFAHEVSIIDLIFNEGPNAYRYMKSF